MRGACRARRRAAAARRQPQLAACARPGGPAPPARPACPGPLAGDAGSAVGHAGRREPRRVSELGTRVGAAGIKGYAGHPVVEAGPGPDKARVAGAVLCPLDPEGKPRTDSAVRLACDGIVMSVGWAPAGGLLYQAGGRFSYA